MSGNEAQVPLVAHVIYALGTGGLENGLVNIINRTPPGRYRHAVICLTSAEDFAARITAPDVSVVELHKAPGHDFGVYRRLRSVLREMQPQVVHSRNLAALEAQLATLFTGVRRVHGEHGRDVSDLDGSNWKYRLLRRVMSPLIHRYIAVSRDLADWLVQVIGIAPGRVQQIYNGVDRSHFRPGPGAAARGSLLPAGFVPGDDTVIIGTVGRMAEVKNQACLLSALDLLLKDNPQWRRRVRLVLVGDGPLRPALERQVVERELQDVVWLAGDRDDVHELLRVMDVFALPSLAEGISNTVLEAMASGLPVLASDVGGNPELVQPGANGALLPVSDTAAWAWALRDLVDDAQERRRLGANGLRRVEQQFNWSRTVDAYLGLYDELLGRQPVTVGTGAG